MADTWNGPTANWDDGLDWSGGEPNSTDDVVITSGEPIITSTTNAGTIASLSNVGGVLDFDDGTLDVTGAASNSSELYLDISSGQGGSLLAIGGALTNTSSIQIGSGNSTLSANSTLQAGSLNNTSGTINLYGSTSGTAEIDITGAGAASLGTSAGTLAGTVNLNGDSKIVFDGATTGITKIAAGGQLSLGGSDGTTDSIQEGAGGANNSALTGLNSNLGSLFLYNGASITTTGALSNSGSLALDQSGSTGGASLTVGGALTNTSGLQIGSGNNTLTTDDLLEAASLNNTSGTINLDGSTSGTAEIEITGGGSVSLGASAGTLAGTVNLDGDAKIVFDGATTSITKIAASSTLSLGGSDGTTDSIQDGAMGANNSALTGLNSNLGSLFLYNGASITTSGALSNSGSLALDQSGGTGGASLTVTGALTNSSGLQIGSGNNTLTTDDNLEAASLNNTSGTINLDGSTAGTAEIEITGGGSVSLGASAGTLAGTVNLNGDAKIVFDGATTSITKIAASSTLSLGGSDGTTDSIQDGAMGANNSALTGLNSNLGSLYLYNGASITTSGALSNSGTLELDQSGNSGGAALTVTGALTNTSTLQVGSGNNTLTTDDNLKAASLNNTSGTINLYGSAAGTAEIEITGAGAASLGTSAGTLSGTVNLIGDSKIVFDGTGGITKIAANATLSLGGSDGTTDSIQDGATGANNSALTGLNSNLGNLYLYNGASIDASGPLTNSGNLALDQSGGTGGSVLQVAGLLTNSSSLQVGNTSLSSNDIVEANDGLVNTSAINIYGSTSGKGTLAVTGSANNESGGNISVNNYAAFTVGGTYTQSGTGDLTLQLIGSGAGQHSSLADSGAGVDIAGGELTASLGGVTLLAGQTYNLVTFHNNDLTGVYDTLDVGGNTGVSTDVNIGGGLIAGLVYDDAAGNIQLQIATAPTSTAETWTATGAGNWTTSADWSNAAAPVFYSDVTIGSGGTTAVTLSNDATVDSLTLNSGDSLTTGSGTDLTIGTTLTTAASSTLTIGGKSFVDGGATDGGSIVVGGSLLDIRGAASGSGAFTVDSGATLEFGSTEGETVNFNGANATLQLDAPGSFTGTLDDMIVGDAIDLSNVKYTGTPPSVSGGTTLNVTENGHTYTFSLENAGAGTFTAAADASGNGTIVELACYGRGTRILTERGEIAIEDLSIADMAVTASGASRPIRWTGHRGIDISRHPNPEAVRPVRVSKNAFGEGLPRRDLYLSPWHNVACEGALMPIIALVNGFSVSVCDASEVEYWHVELDTHDVILADGLPAESYLDTGNRTAFVNGGAFIEAHPDFAPKHWAETCLPLVQEGPAVTSVKARLLEVLRAQGLEPTCDGDAHIIADGRRLEPTAASSMQLSFVLPERCREVILTSRRFTPTHVIPESPDSRELGICIARLQIDGVDIPLEREDLFEDGWREAEWEDGRVVRRWTGGAARLPAGARSVSVDLAGDGYYWRVQDGGVAALAA